MLTTPSETSLRHRHVPAALDRPILLETGVAVARRFSEVQSMTSTATTPDVFERVAMSDYSSDSSSERLLAIEVEEPPLTFGKKLKRVLYSIFVLPFVKIAEAGRALWRYLFGGGDESGSRHEETPVLELTPSPLTCSPKTPECNPEDFLSAITLSPTAASLREAFDVELSLQPSDVESDITEEDNELSKNRIALGRKVRLIRSAARQFYKQEAVLDRDITTGKDILEQFINLHPRTWCLTTSEFEKLHDFFHQLTVRNPDFNSRTKIKFRHTLFTILAQLCTLIEEISFHQRGQDINGQLLDSPKFGSPIKRQVNLLKEILDSLGRERMTSREDARNFLPKLTEYLTKSADIKLETTESPLSPLSPTRRARAIPDVGSSSASDH